MKNSYKQSISTFMWFVMALSLMSCGSEIIDVDGGDLDVLVENEVQEFDATDDVDAADDTLREDLIDASFADGLSDEGGSCVPDCTDIECTPEPLCGYYVCGVCESRHECESGRCVFYSTWAQDQYNVECGDDGMCLVPASTFMMGCDEDVDSYCNYQYSHTEGPVHSVTLSAYYIDRTEVTVADYAECVDAGVCTEPLTDSEMIDQSIENNCNWNVFARGDHPVNCVNWTQASTYCDWLGKRLPTEAEWEMAARGTDNRNFPWGIAEPTCDLTNYNVTTMDSESLGCGTGTTGVVCTNSPDGDSPYGLCDMAGNVYELVNDIYSDTYYTKDPEVNPQGPDTGNYRVIRGGAYTSVEGTLRTTWRYFVSAGDARGYLGFRCVKSAD